MSKSQEVDKILESVERSAQAPAVFHDREHNASIKFHIQKNMSQEMIDWIKDCIVKNGGEVISQVPLKGYVLIDPASAKGQRLAAKWVTGDKPGRHVVGYTWVPASVANGSLLPIQDFEKITPIFIRDDAPVAFHVSTAFEPPVLQDLRVKIATYGGKVLEQHPKSGVIVADINKPAYRRLVKKYEHSDDVWIESPEWLQTCIANQKYEHVLPVRKNVGGRKPGSTRTEYTAEDDAFLVAYIGKRIPYPTMAGRTGNELFKQLCERTDLYPWASRHSWNSWRNRYKTNRARFDSEIAEWVETHPQPLNGKGQYVINHSRKEPMPGSGADDEEDEDGDDDIIVEADASPSMISNRPKRKGVGRRPYNSDSEEDVKPPKRPRPIDPNEPEGAGGSSNVEELMTMHLQNP
ncbi:hypothetical protein FRC03_010618 [Tulasnella sp. 419]|nr:hypothetical protein FRC03_010618 [Tulasnella sp. 419]